HPFGLTLHRLEIGAEGDTAVPLDKLEIGTLSHRAGGKLSAQVSEQIAGLAGVLADDLKQRMVRLPGLIQFEARNAQTLLEDIGRMDRRAAGGDAADVAVMRHGASPADELAFREQWLDDVKIREMLTGGTIGVI